jgi:hypothetical protein
LGEQERLGTIKRLAFRNRFGKNVQMFDKLWLVETCARTEESLEHLLPNL